MTSRDTAIGTVFLSQTVFGILGNFYLLYHYVFLYFTECMLRPTDLILQHLTVANSLVLLAKGVPHTMEALGGKYLLNDFGCKLLLYVHRVGRGVSISTTCLLSVLQAITISPLNRRWAMLKVKAPKHVSFLIFLCWVVYMLVNTVFPIYLTADWSTKNITNYKKFGPCSAVRHDKATDSVFAALLSFPDVVCLGLMLGASSCMVLILHRHKQRVQHIHSTNVSPRLSAESRATQRVLVLGSTFVGFYLLSSILHMCIALSHNPGWWLMTLSAVAAVCFPAVSPFLLMNRAHSVSRFCSTWIRNTKSPHLI
ncbi:vomeronasal type-1 receptor 4-like [Manis pentadactyla]|uniref:vomeronasal type-1 receptor 4-like n=1 Tax=Manis pentadactyla TaxID=143292 RepID=UPI00187718D2|nr:vomeronasal type-1 receptor 4-like [Manis pentadactyla]